MSFSSQRLMSVAVFLAASGPLQAKTLEKVLEGMPEKHARLSQIVTKVVEKYRADESRERESLIEQLDALATRLRNNRRGPSTATQITEIIDVKHWIRSGGDVPVSQMALNIIVPYAEKLESKRNAVRPPLKRLMNGLNADKREELTLELERAFDNLGGRMSARAVVKPGASFAGYRTSQNGADLITIRMEIRDSRDREFSGRVERDLGISHHPIHSMTGKIDGMKILVETGPTAAYGHKLDHNWKYEGYVIGDTILGRYYGKTRRGKPVDGLFHMKQR